MTDEDRSLLNYDGPMPAGPYKSLASFTPEQTAAFFRGESLGRPQWEDPEVQAKMDRQRELLRDALSQSVNCMAGALRELSPSTAARLRNLADGALAGDQHRLRLFVGMYTELLSQALFD